MAERPDMKLVQSKLTVCKKILKNLLIFLQGCVSPNEFEHLLENILNFFLDLVEDPLIQLPGRKYPGIFQVDEMSGSFCLREIQDSFEVGDAHFTVDHNQHEDSQP